MLNTQPAMLLLLAGLLVMAALAYVWGRTRAVMVEANGARLASQPAQYGWLTLAWMALPAVSAAIAMGFLDLIGWFDPATSVVILGTVLSAATGLAMGLRLVRPQVRAHELLERIVERILLTAALISIVTTIGIVMSVLFEAIRFFQLVSFWEFITGTVWDPDPGFGADAGDVQARFGSLPLFAGTFMITGIALAVAVPIGLLSAIYTSEYATKRVREAAKPALEILAGIPSVVYGFFAAITVAPLVVAAAGFIGLDASYESALAAGTVMGIMIIPLVSSLSDDVLRSVPRSLREGSYALGLTEAETIRHVVLPAAAPGVIAATLLAMSTAVGETMIVVMAAGLLPNLSWNPLESMTTVTVRIVDALTGDQSFDSAETLSAFALGLVLFVVTLVLNLLSMILIRRFRRVYS